MGAFLRFARRWSAVREVDFLVVAVSLLTALVAYRFLPVWGGVIGFHPALGAFSSLGVLGVTLLLAFFGLPLALGTYAALRPGQLRGIPLRVAVATTLVVESLVAIVAGTMALAYSTILLMVPEAVSFFGIPNAQPWQLHLVRVAALLVLARVALVLVLIPAHRGTAYVAGDEPRRVLVAASLTAVAVIVASRLVGQLSSFALVDAWTAASIVAALVRGPTHEG